MKKFKVKISPEVLKEDLSRVEYSGQTLGFYSGLSHVLSAGTIDLGSWNVQNFPGVGCIGVTTTQLLGPNTSVIWINDKGLDDKIWNGYFKDVVVGSSFFVKNNQGNTLEFKTTQKSQLSVNPDGTNVFSFVVSPNNVTETIPIGETVDLKIVQPNTSELIDLSIPVLLEQDYQDIGYYSQFDGYISQFSEEVNFTFESNLDEPFKYCIYNTSNYNLNYFQNAVYYVDWGDGTPVQQVEVFIPQKFCHTYSSLDIAQKYTISFSGTSTLGTYTVSKKVEVPYTQAFISNIGQVSFASNIGLKSLTNNNGVGSNGLFSPTNSLCGVNPSQIDPSLLKEFNELESFITNSVENNRALVLNNAPVITIPVVFHVLWNDVFTNLSDTYILAQLEQINLDFGGTNPDINLTPPYFTAGTMNIQFCLATQDPDGRPTTGIIRKYIPYGSYYEGPEDRWNFFDSLGGSQIWPRESYLNIYIMRLGGGLLGFATLGPTYLTPDKDGIVISWGTAGSNNLIGGFGSQYGRGRTLTHEIGHWLGLRHIWGDANCGSDFVSDTPTQQGPTDGCGTIISCGNGPNGQMYMNYMDYGYDTCHYMFTPGQVARARTLLSPGTNTRYSLLSSTGCQPPILPPTATPTTTINPTLPPTPPPPTPTVTTTVTTTTPGPTPTITSTVTTTTPGPTTTPPEPTPTPTPVDSSLRGFYDAFNSRSLDYVSVPFIVSGFTESKLNDLAVYGPNSFINDLEISLPDGTTGYVVSQTPEYIEYVINGQTYIDFANGTTIFVVESEGLTDYTTTATTITKFEYLMNVIEQPEIQSNVFIERGKYSGLENFRRIGEVNNTGALESYGYGFFDVKKYNQV